MLKRQLRALGRVPKGLGIIAGVAWDLYVKKVEGEELEQLSKNLYRNLAGLFGIKIVFNAASVPFEKDFPLLIPANHASVADFIVMGSVADGKFAGKELKLPPRLLEAMHYTGIPRVNKDHPEFKNNVLRTLGHFINKLNAGVNTLFFPEGTTTDGTVVALFRAALFKGFYGQNGLDRHGNEVGLEREARVQPVGIRVLDVEGKSVDLRPEKLHYYSHYNTTGALRRIWTRLATESITVEVKVFPAMNPKDYSSAEDLANTAGALVRAFVAPNQTVIEKAKIPGVAERGETVATAPRNSGMY